jgi:hypothetical protein
VGKVKVYKNLTTRYLLHTSRSFAAEAADICCRIPGALQQMLLATQGGKLIDQNSHCVVVTLGLNFKTLFLIFPISDCET